MRQSKMLQVIRLALLLWLYLLTGSHTHALTLNEQSSGININHDIAYWEDPTGKASYADIVSGRSAIVFRNPDYKDKVLNLGFSNSVYWVRLTIDRSPKTHADWVLEAPYLGIDHIDLYNPDGTISENGSQTSVLDRPLYSRFYAFPLRVNNEPTTYYLRISSSYAITLPLRLVDQHRFNQLQARENLLQFLYFGGILALLLYNLILYIAIRDSKYLIYSLFTLFTGLGIFAGNGYGSIYLWPHALSWDAISQSFLLSIAAFLGLQFTTAFLKTRRYLPKTYLILQALGGFYVVLASSLLLTLWFKLPVELIYEGIFLLTFLTPLVVIGTCLRNIRYKIRSAHYFLAAWGVLCIGVFVSAARIFGLLPSNWFTLYALQISSGIEMLLFSLALAYRIQWEREKREHTQTALIAAQKETVHALQLTEERLEAAVDVRTNKIQRLLLSEQHMRSQYTRFCALIAHEFRNPLNIIQAQATVLERDQTPNPEKNKLRTDVIRSAIARLVKLFDQWLENDRVNMAMDDIQRKIVDLSPWLREICNNCDVYYDNHSIKLTYCASKSTAYVDEHLLEIALLNLIDNACKYSSDSTAIEVDLVTDHEEIGIRVIDHGPGIPPDQIKQILEPYIRAAHSEQNPNGIGLGLAFVQRIVELHDGRININSVVGQGSEITLWLPASH